MTVAAGARSRPKSARRFYLAMGIAILAVEMLGFGRSFFFRPWFPGYLAHSPSEPWFYVHGAVFTAWLGLFIVQTSLVAAGNVSLHRKLGVVGFALVPLMVALAGVGALIAARRPSGFVDIPEPPLQFLLTPLSSTLLFAIFAGMALARRRDADLHTHLILLASIALLEPGIVRWPFAFVNSGPELGFWLATLFLIPLGLWDIAKRGRPAAVTIWGSLLFVAVGLLRDPLSTTPAWLAFAHWAVGLVG